MRQTVGEMERQADSVQGFAFLEAPMRSPQALSSFPETVGKTVLEHAGAILEERL